MDILIPLRLCRRGIFTAFFFSAVGRSFGMKSALRLLKERVSYTRFDGCADRRYAGHAQILRFWCGGRPGASAPPRLAPRGAKPRGSRSQRDANGRPPCFISAASIGAAHPANLVLRSGFLIEHAPNDQSLFSPFDTASLLLNMCCVVDRKKHIERRRIRAHPAENIVCESSADLYGGVLRIVEYAWNDRSQISILRCLSACSPEALFYRTDQLSPFAGRAGIR